MQIFKKGEDKPNTSSDIKETENIKKYKVKKKTKIGFKFKKEKNPPKEIITNEKDDDNKINEIDKQIDEIEVKPTPETQEEIKQTSEPLEETKKEPIKKANKKQKEDDVEEQDTKIQWASTKKKIFTKNMKGKPVYLEDTGEKLGTVFDMIYDSNNKLVGYKIKDHKSDSVLSFPCDQFDENKDGLIFVQNWYTNATKILDRLEFKERISPELTTLIGDEAISDEELYHIFVKHDDQMVNYIDEAISLKNLLSQRLSYLEKKRLSLKDKLMDLTEKRLIQDIDKREFSELVTDHRHKVNVLDVNIKKCKDLLKRLDSTSFGKLGRNISSNKKNLNEDDKDFRIIDDKISEKGLVFTEEIENPYKQKYNDIKEKYETLQENYNELKLAVEKLISKDEI